jgi:hypothetical protein
MHYNQTVTLKTLSQLGFTGRIEEGYFITASKAVNQYLVPFLGYEAVIKKIDLLSKTATLKIVFPDNLGKVLLWNVPFDFIAEHKEVNGNEKET